MAYLVMLETASNQSFIFATNRQREQVGASELIARCTVQWVLDALPSGSHPLAGMSSVDSGELAEQLHDETKNPPLTDDSQVELLSVSSGKSLLLCGRQDVARTIIAEVTGRALREAPGLTVRGVTVAYGPSSPAAGSVMQAVEVAHRTMGSVRAAVPPESARFPQDPLTAVCADSGLPALRFARPLGGKTPIPRSASSVVKEQVAREGYRRIRQALSSAVDAGHLHIPEFAEQRDEVRRPAVLHADGNSIGALFQLLAPVSEALAAEDGEDASVGFTRRVRLLSAGLDEATRLAMLDALAGAAAVRHAPVTMLPLILGGDDVTAVVDGPAAWDVATGFLRAFEQHTGDPDGPLAELLADLGRVSLSDPEQQRQAAQASTGLTASAGFVIVPRTYPFHAAYELAESATRSAKQAKTRALTVSGRPLSAVDFHVHYDQTGDDLTLLRSRRRGGEGTDAVLLAGGPYLLVDGHDLPEQPGNAGGWDALDITRRNLARITGWREVLAPATRRQRDDGEGDEGADTPQLSRTTIRRLRAALVQGASAWQAERAFLRPEQRSELEAFEADPALGELVVPVGAATAHGGHGADGTAQKMSILLDVLELVGAETVGDE